MCIRDSSQILRGFAQAASYGATEGEMLAVALTNAVGFVDRAIAEPVEGTIITVLRAAADAARPAHRADGQRLGDLGQARAVFQLRGGLDRSSHRVRHVGASVPVRNWENVEFVDLRALALQLA